ncbi:metal ABC transporter solute-binding protein, Zn/Mn family [uncultured Clostridium sp.]|uniref:metal ABC transporter substrate-binding protein n=1 Tax=uncultured Clostridium sp. TaxID=59620 RepID=UPI0025FF45ED|nr:zinc ABC transporter substrate-binding protein [uncultured Clostridium sp.]
MKKITFAMVLITIVLSLGMSVFSSPLLANTDNSTANRVQSRDRYLNIMTVSKPQYDMVKKITKDKHNVEYMFTEEKDISDFKYNNEVIDNVSSMDLFMYSGTSFEPWTNTFIDELKKGNLGIINLARGVRLLNYDVEGSSRENPYYFSGMEEYKIALYNAKAAIQDRDPQNRDYYEDNYNDAVKEFDEKINKYSKKVSGLNDFTFVTLSSDFDYLLKGLGLNTLRVDNRELGEFIKINNLDINKVVVVDDGEKPSDLDLSPYYSVKLWKYYGKMSFDDLIEYNVNELCKFAKEEIVEENTQDNVDSDKNKTENS